ncbi:MAG: hypothetical protein WA004_19535 [Saprospiraceae bacterium]
MKRPNSSTYVKFLAGIAGLAVMALLGMKLFAPAKEEGLSLFQYLSENEVHAIDIQVDMHSVLEKDSVWFPAILSWQDASGSKTEVQVELEARGKNRREVCEFPPLKMRVVPGDGHPFRKGSYKVVTHCLEGSGESLLLREYLVYQLYGALTENSFRTNLLAVTYTDKSGAVPPVRSRIILLEGKKEILARLDATDLEAEEPVREISATDYHLFAVFQFMIGNTDWNLDKEHNVRLIARGENALPIPVPYDFDRSGLVNAPYAEPHPMLPIDNVRERFFQWRGKDRKQLEPVLALFRERHDRLMNLIWEMEELPLAERQDIVRYLEEFFENMDLLLTEGRYNSGWGQFVVQGEIG